MSNRSARYKVVISAVVLAVFSLTVLTGCASFRKKFIRQNKNRTVKEDFAPVLEPMEYRRVEMSPLDAYRNHYAMLKAYFSDVYAALSARDSGEKREKYLLNQVLAHLQGMSDILDETRKPKALTIMANLREAMKELEKPEGLRRHDLLESTVHRAEADVRRTLKPDMIKEFIAAQ